MSDSDNWDRRSSSDEDGRFGHWPLGGPFLIVLFLLGLAALLFVNVAGFAYERIGIDRGWFTAIVFGSLVGSRVNIPIWRFPDRVRVESEQVSVFGILYRIPARTTGRSILAVNVGGAIIPTAVSIYLILHDHIWQHSLIAVACVAVVVFAVARPVKGVGIVTPSLLPPAAAAIAAVVIGRPAEAALAYVCGTLGTLLGADLMNLWRVRDLGAPEASIGGAGTFDGVFLSGLLAVVLASL